MAGRLYLRLERLKAVKSIIPKLQHVAVHKSFSQKRASSLYFNIYSLNSKNRTSFIAAQN